MKKEKRVHLTTYITGRAYTRQMRARSNIKWVVISVVCITAFCCVIGIANAAQTSGGSWVATKKEQNIQRLLNAGRMHTHPKMGSQNQIPAVQPAPIRHAGIVNMHQGPFASSIFTVRNFWQGSVGSDWVMAYAGAKPHPDSTLGPGGVVLYSETANAQGGFDMHPQGTFLAPKGATSLTITGMNKNLLLLHSQSGTQLTFDLVTHQFH